MLYSYLVHYIKICIFCLYILFVYLYSEKYCYIIEKTIYCKENCNSGKNNSLRRLEIFNCVGCF